MPLRPSAGWTTRRTLYTPGRFVFTTATAGLDHAVGRRGTDGKFRLGPGDRPAAGCGEDDIRGRRRPSSGCMHAANDFIVARKSPDGRPGCTVIAGYPWFADWGRDTMISLPGLFLHTGTVRGSPPGPVPLRPIRQRGNDPQPVRRLHQRALVQHGGCQPLVHSRGVRIPAALGRFGKPSKELLRPACHAIVDGYTQGTRYHIKVDPADGLVTQGDESTQLTWMDAKCNGVCFHAAAGQGRGDQRAVASRPAADRRSSAGRPGGREFSQGVLAQSVSGIGGRGERLGAGRVDAAQSDFRGEPSATAR